jgi:cyclopropane-fatty-acyl-phospholipid synthase
MKKFLRTSAENYVKNLFHQADVVINGDRPWDIQVKNNDFYPRVILQGSLGLGESYVEGAWDCETLDQLFCNILQADLRSKAVANLPDFFKMLKARVMNRQSRRRAFQVGEEHDAGNDLFEIMLDSSMAYSCGYWKQADTLEQAQQNKLDIICKKLKLAKGMHLLDIGCGWGSLVQHAARYYGVEAVGITVSKEQARLAEERCSTLPVKIIVQDYRDLTGQYDAVACVGMFEHVGQKNYRTFMKVVRRCLHGNGLFLLHTIGSNRAQVSCDRWFDKYIFPNGTLPAIVQVGSALEGNFVMEDWHNLGVDYDKTLMAWYQNFENNWNRIKTAYPESFFRMWRYYLLSLAGGFRARHMQVWQIVASPRGNVEGYTSVRCPQCAQPGYLPSI